MSLSRFSSVLVLACAPCLPWLGGCRAGAVEDVAPAEDAITSNHADLLDFRFEGVVTTGADEPTRQAIVSQLQYVQGMLTSAEGGNAQVGLVKLANIRESSAGEDGGKRITYTASLPVAWPKGKTAPTTYALPLPADTRAFGAFNAKYDGACGDNEYGRETFWHDFDPTADGCEIADEDVSRAQASVVAHAASTQGKFPEYDRIWEDDTLDVVAVFGIISSHSPSDDGVREMKTLIAEASRGLSDEQKEEITPEGSVLEGTRLTGKLTVGGRERTLNLTALLVHSVESADGAFDAIYGPASEKADFIYYGGHSGLGKNIASLATRARVKAGKYQLLYLNGCQTFAYLGSAWHDKKREANGEANDPDGTKDLDIFATALPAYDDGGRSMNTIYKAIVDQTQPKSYNTLLESFSRRHLTVVFGEEDNRFTPPREVARN